MKSFLTPKLLVGGGSAPAEALLGDETAGREYGQAGHRLDKTAAAARAAGASWVDIGRAVGISRQAAHEWRADKQ